MDRTEAIEAIKLLRCLSEVNGAEKIQSTFISTFLEKARTDATGQSFIHGSFNLGGTISSRMSSSKPNMQTIPSGSQYGKLVKECFALAGDWMFCGADFALT